MWQEAEEKDCCPEVIVVRGIIIHPWALTNASVKATKKNQGRQNVLIAIDFKSQDKAMREKRSGMS